MKNHLFSILVAVLLLAGCQSPGEAPTPEPVAVDSSVEPEISPTNTAVPEPTSTSPPTPIPPTPPPPPTPSPPATATLPPDPPDLVWLPYATGNYGQPVLMLEEGEITLQPLPVEVEIFFDYEPESGWLAYGSKFWGATADQQSVTDLNIYSFVAEASLAWADSIGRAEISPVNQVSGQPNVAVAFYNGQDFELIVLLGPDNAVPLVENIDPYFSWSPDGGEIAYLRNGDLFITSAAGDTGNQPIAGGIYQGSQWIGDAPLWLGDSGYLLVAENPFFIVASDGSDTILPVGANGNEMVGPRPLAMLYSQSVNQLVAESEGMFGSSVLVYQFSEDFATAVIVAEIEDAQLAGWYEEDTSVVLVRGGEPEVLPLTPLN